MCHGVSHPYSLLQCDFVSSSSALLYLIVICDCFWPTDNSRNDAMTILGIALTGLATFFSYFLEHSLLGHSLLEPRDCEKEETQANMKRPCGTLCLTALTGCSPQSALSTNQEGEPCWMSRPTEHAAQPHRAIKCRRNPKQEPSRRTQSTLNHKR